MLTDPLLERESELEQFEAVLTGLAHGEGAVVAIEGEAGIGKTAMLVALTDRARSREIQVLTARGIERERDIPFGVVRQLLEPVVRRSQASDREELIAGAARLALPVVLPETAERVSRSQGALLHGLYWLLANLSERGPLVVAIDDLHWSDRASLAFANYAVQRLDGLPVIVSMAVRSTDREAQFEAVEALVASASLVIRPQPLSVGAVKALIEEGLSAEADDEFCEACQRATGGNPFLVHELVRELERRGVAPRVASAAEVVGLAPASVSRTVRSRIERLAVTARRLVEAVAVFGDSAELRQAAELVEVEPDAAATTADDLARAGILAPGRPLRFQHPLMRAAVDDSLTAGDAARLHGRAARILEAEGTPPERCAVHLLHTDGNQDAGAVELLRAAARHALARGAATNAVEYLRRALREPPAAELRATLLHETGRAELRAGELSAVEHLELALDQNREPARRSAIAHDLARASLMSGAIDAAIKALDRESARIWSDDRDTALRLEAESLSVTWVERGTAGLDQNRIARARSLTGVTVGERAVLAAIVPLIAAAGDVPAEEVADLCERALGGGELLSDLGSEAPQFVLVPQELAYTDRLADAAWHLDRGIDDARRAGSAMGFFFCAGMRSMVACRCGELASAVSFATEAVEVARQHGWVTSFPTGGALLAEALIEQGEVDAAGRVLKEVQPASDPVTRRGRLMFNQIRYRQALLHLARGEVAAAVQELFALDQDKRRIGDLNPGRHPWLAVLAIALASSGDGPRAQTYAREALERAERWGTRTSIGLALRAVARTCEGSERLDRLRRSVALLEASPARLEYARALLDLGAALAPSGRAEDARGTLRTALDIADSCGAAPLAEEVRKELVAAGGRPRRPRTSGPSALTPSERRIAELAAAGQSNPAIAQSLFVTPKTVETHLSSVYRKLGIRSRRELPEALRR